MLKKLFFLFLLASNLQADELDQKLEEANQAYQEAISQENVSIKQQYFNLALGLYSEMEEKLKGNHSLGPLYYNIGNIYFYLSEYPLAITYYYRATQTIPHDPKLIQNLNYALEKMGIEDRYHAPHLNDYDLLKIFGGLAAFSIFLFSLHVWVKNRMLFFGALFFSATGLLCLCFAVFLRLTTPVEAVVIYPGLLRLGPGSDFPTVNENPVFPGKKIRVIDVTREGKWLKVISPNNQIGYIYYKSVRVI